MQMGCASSPWPGEEDGARWEEDRPSRLAAEGWTSLSADDILGWLSCSSCRGCRQSWEAIPGAAGLPGLPAGAWTGCEMR